MRSDESNAAGDGRYARGLRPAVAAALCGGLLAGCVAAGGTDVTGTPSAPGEVLSVGGVSYRAEFRPDMLWMQQARDAAGLPKLDAAGAPEITRRIVDAPTAGLKIARADGGALGPGDERTARAVADAFCAAQPDLAQAARFGRSFLYSGGVWTVLEVCG